MLWSQPSLFVPADHSRISSHLVQHCINSEIFVFQATIWIIVCSFCAILFIITKRQSLGPAAIIVLGMCTSASLQLLLLFLILHNFKMYLIIKVSNVSWYFWVSESCPSSSIANRTRHFRDWDYFYSQVESWSGLVKVNFTY